MSGKTRRAEENRDIRMLDFQRGEEDDLGYAELREITTCPECRGRCEDKHGLPCPECRGRCEDKHGLPCPVCHGEGEI